LQEKYKQVKEAVLAKSTSHDVHLPHAQNTRHTTCRAQADLPQLTDQENSFTSAWHGTDHSVAYTYSTVNAHATPSIFRHSASLHAAAKAVLHLRLLPATLRAPALAQKHIQQYSFRGNIWSARKLGFIVVVAQWPAAAGLALAARAAAGAAAGTQTSLWRLFMV
jgi:hypothetical protein